MSAPIADNVTALAGRAADPTSKALDIAQLENELRATLRAAIAHLGELHQYVHAIRPFDEPNRKGAYELRLAVQQELEAVRWRVANELVCFPMPEPVAASLVQRIATMTRELTEESSVVEDAANKAWAHLAALVKAVSPLS